MTTLAKKIENQALGLTVEERVCLAEKLLSSLDSPRQYLIDEKWANETEDRIQAFDRGEIKASDAALVFERLEDKYKM